MAAADPSGKGFLVRRRPWCRRVSRIVIREETRWNPRDGEGRAALDFEGSDRFRTTARNLLFGPSAHESPVGVGCWGFSGLILIWRYRLVKEILCQGTDITGTAAVVDVYETNRKSDSSTNRFVRRFAYDVTIRYEQQGTERKARYKLPHSPSFYGIRKDEPVELIALDSSSSKPLIRSLYTERPRR